MNKRGTKTTVVTLEVGWKIGNRKESMSIINENRLNDPNKGTSKLGANFQQIVSN